MIPYEQLCAALDRYNNVAPAEEPILAVEEAEVVEEALAYEEAPAYEEAQVYEETPAEVAAALDETFPAEDSPVNYAEPAAEPVIYSSAGEDAAAASGFIGGAASPEPVVPQESAIEVEPALEHRLDHTDEVSLDDVEMVGDTDPQDPNAQG